MIPYSPLASGRLTRDWSETTHRSETDMVQKSKYDATADADRVIVERVAEIAAERGIPRVQVALAWLLQNNRLQHLSLVRPKFRISKMQQLLFRSISHRRRLPPLKSRMYLTGLWARYNLSRPNHHKEKHVNASGLTLDKTGLRELFLQRGF